REWLVVATRHQALNHVAADRLHGETLNDQRVEAVKSPEHPLHQLTASRCIGIDVRRRSETVRHRRRTMHGDGVSGLRGMAPCQRDSESKTVQCQANTRA